jgi:hypothetical protein
MVKCYPSFWDRETAVEDYFAKLKYFKTLAEKQGKVLDFFTDNLEEKDLQPKLDFEVSPEIRSITRASISHRGWNPSSLPKLDTEGWMKRTVSESQRFEYREKKSNLGTRFENLHESTLYVNHFC